MLIKVGKRKGFMLWKFLDQDVNTIPLRWTVELPSLSSVNLWRDELVLFLDVHSLLGDHIWNEIFYEEPPVFWTFLSAEYVECVFGGVQYRRHRDAIAGVRDNDQYPRLQWFLMIRSFNVKFFRPRFSSYTWGNA